MAHSVGSLTQVDQVVRGAALSTTHQECNSLALQLYPDGIPSVFLMGARRSGKTSIQRVVFEKMPPHETMYIDSTIEIRRIDIAHNPMMQFRILDFPGGFNFHDTELKAQELFPMCRVLVFVLDAQDKKSFGDQISYILSIIELAVKWRDAVQVAVLIHKTDSDAASYFSNEAKLDLQREVRQQLQDELPRRNLDSVTMDFHCTSIYDHTVYHAFSKIAQQLLPIPVAKFLESTLNAYINTCGIEKTFLFDVISKIYIGSDSNPVEMNTFAMCSDVIDVVVDVSSIYGAEQGAAIGFDEQSNARIKLNKGKTIVDLRHVGPYLAMVSTSKDDPKTKGVVEHNFQVFKKHVAELLSLGGGS